MLYLIEYESSRWATAPYNCVVEADNEDAAITVAENFMENHMYETFIDDDQDLLEEDPEAFDGESSFNVISVVKFDETHEYWKYYQDPSQAEFFPLVS